LFASFVEGGKQNTNQNGNDSDDNKQLNQCEAPGCSRSTEVFEHSQLQSEPASA
jgi:hypothetical protein